MAWRLVRSLDVQRSQVRAEAPRAVPPATAASAWGTIGDTAHTSTSDHSPHVYAALGSTAVVCAADYPHAPALGLDGGRFTEALRLSRDPRIGYVIFNGRIFSGHQVGNVPPYVWRDYDEDDDHRTHWHVSTVHTALADDTRPWAMPSGTTTGDDMALSEPVNWPRQFIDPSRDYPLWLGGSLGNQLQYMRETTYFTWLLARQNAGVLAAIAEKVDIDAGELAAIEQASRDGAAAAFALAQESLVAAIVREVGGVAGGGAGVGIDAEAIEAAVRRVFADAAAPHAG